MELMKKSTKAYVEMIIETNKKEITKAIKQNDLIIRYLIAYFLQNIIFSFILMIKKQLLFWLKKSLSKYIYLLKIVYQLLFSRNFFRNNKK